MDGGGFYPVLTQIAHLVFHQRYERGDYHADSVHGHCRYLESDTLAASRRHESQSVTAAADALYDLFLYASETVVTPVLLEYLQVCHNCLSGFLLRLVGLDALYLEQYVALLEVVFLYGIADIK